MKRDTTTAYPMSKSIVRAVRIYQNLTPRSRRTLDRIAAANGINPAETIRRMLNLRQWSRRIQPLAGFAATDTIKGVRA